jgi:hypothetical protein
MSNFEAIKATLKDKWLDYYQDNQSWIMIIKCWQSYPYAKRPNSKVILGSILVLEPAIKPYLLPMLQIDKTGEDVIASLGLNFDPRDEIRKNPKKSVSSVTQEAVISLTDIQPILKDKWLTFFQGNSDLMDIFDIWKEINDSSGEKRPIADFILAVISVLDPRVKDYLIALCGVDKTLTKVIEALGLNFDPRFELDKQQNNSAPIVDFEYEEMSRYLNEIRELKTDGNSS